MMIMCVSESWLKFTAEYNLQVSAHSTHNSVEIALKLPVTKHRAGWSP